MAKQKCEHVGQTCRQAHLLTRVVRIRLSVHAYQQLLTAAEKEGHTLSEVLRNKITWGAV